MNNQNNFKVDLVLLRTNAEKLIERNSFEKTTQFSEVDYQKLIHELEVHRIELEMQNEELRESKLREEQLATEKYNQLYDFLQIGCITLTAEKEIYNLNLSGANILGKERESLIKSRFDFFVSEDERIDFDLFFIHVLYSNTKASCKLNLLLEQTKPLYVQLSAISSSKGDQCLMTIIDITDIKNAELEITRKNAELLSLVAEKDKFFSILAHDLRSPFNVLLGTTQMLMDRDSLMSLDDIQSFAKMINTSANNLYGLLEDLLKWSNLQMGKISYNPKLIKLLPAISAGLRSVTELIDNKLIDFRIEVSHNLTVFADVDMLELILRNIVVNAVKFTPRSGKITLSARQLDDQFIEISIRDSGIGMKKVMIENLFRLDGGINRMGTEGEAGTGLGLILCNDFIKKHDGKIWVKSEVDKGSTFHFTIPSENAIENE